MLPLYHNITKPAKFDPIFNLFASARSGHEQCEFRSNRPNYRRYGILGALFADCIGFSKCNQGTGCSQREPLNVKPMFEAIILAACLQVRGLKNLATEVANHKAHGNGDAHS